MNRNRFFFSSLLHSVLLQHVLIVCCCLYCSWRCLSHKLPCTCRAIVFTYPMQIYNNTREDVIFFTGNGDARREQAKENIEWKIVSVAARMVAPRACISFSMTIRWMKDIHDCYDVSVKQQYFFVSIFHTFLLSDKIFPWLMRAHRWNAHTQTHIHHTTDHCTR